MKRETRVGVAGIGVLLTLPGICLFGETVEERGGDIYVRDSRGHERRVTDLAEDCSPALSPDGSRIVFVRDLLGNRDYNDFTRSGPATRVMQLWVAATEGRTPPKLLLDSPVAVKGKHFAGFYAPQFAVDGSVYFMVQLGASSGAVVRLDVRTNELAEVTDALDFAVVPSGKYGGDLIVKQHRRKLGIGYYDWFYLMRPTGEEIGVIGQGEQDVYNFLSTYVGEAADCVGRGGGSGLECINQAR